MAEENAQMIKKSIRSRKSAVSKVDPEATDMSLSPRALKVFGEEFRLLIRRIDEAEKDFEKLQKEIGEVREVWLKEQREHKAQVLERDRQEELQRKRERELYDYETSLFRKKAEDEFGEKKLRWERELESRKEEIEKEKEELADLRKQVASFEGKKKRR